jgi:hypothetical protein
MIVEWLSKPIVWAALLSFLVGSFGYVLARLVIRPLLRYHVLKERVRRVTQAPDGPTPPQWQATLREYAGALTSCYNEQLPHWYRMALKKRNEAPLEAARHLMTLSNVSIPQHAARRADDVRRALKLPGLKRNDENL